MLHSDGEDDRERYILRVMAVKASDDSGSNDSHGGDGGGREGGGR